MHEHPAKAVTPRTRREPAAERRFTPPPSRRTSARRSAAAPAVERAGGKPLDERTRARMEARFDHDFSQVRVHHDSDAARLADGAQARAFTVGQDIVFGPGEYAPERPGGERLLAHELAHTVQQEGVSASRDPGDERALEQQASHAADAATRGERAHVAPVTRAPALQREPNPQASPASTRTQARAALRDFLEGQQARQGGKKLIVTPAVILGLEAFLRSDPSARLSMNLYAQPLLDQAVDLDGFAARIGDFLPTQIPATDMTPQPVGPKLDTRGPPGFISKVASAAEKEAPTAPRPEEQEATWRRDFEIGQVRKAEGARGPIPFLPDLIVFPGLDPFFIARTIQGAMETKKKTTAPAANSHVPISIDDLARSFDPLLLVPAEAKASGSGAGSSAEPPEVVRALARMLDLAHRKNDSVVELRLGDNYRGARDRLAVIAELRKLVKQVRDALPMRPTQVDKVILYFGDQQVQSVGLWGGD